MIPWLVDWFSDLSIVEFAAWQKVTLRAALAASISFVLAMFFGSRLIAWLGTHFREPNKSPSAQIERMHAEKAWTPTMGGLFIVAGILLGSLLCCDLTNPFVWGALFIVVMLMSLGIIDDLAKMRGTCGGLPARKKLVAQTIIATIAATAAYLLHCPEGEAMAVAIPFTTVEISIGLFYIPLAVLVIVGASNAVNLTDGLDGLAGGCLVLAFIGMGSVAYLAGHFHWANYLQIEHISGSSEMLIVTGAAIGALLGFLWYNCHPAQVFMGDTGSLPLGGLLGWLAIVARKEILLVIIGGVFVIEAVSVILQLASYRWRKRRIFLCAPLHHHFQLKLWPESRIVVRFWIAATLCTTIGLASLKVSILEDDYPVATSQQKAVEENLAKGQGVK